MVLRSWKRKQSPSQSASRCRAVFSAAACWLCSFSISRGLSVRPWLQASIPRLRATCRRAACEAPEVADLEWAVDISENESKLGLLPRTSARVAEVLNVTGFVVLRGASLFSDEELQLVQKTAEMELQRIKGQTERLGMSEQAPWVNKQDLLDFDFQEALSYSPGRLDTPLLLEKHCLAGTRWSDHPDLRHIAELVFDGSCKQTVLGALWNFPGSSPPVWHRDGLKESLLTAVTAAKDYPETVGFIHGQPYSHFGGRGYDIFSGDAAPQPAKGEMGIPLVLRRGETLLFFYSTKHAATPNLSELERCLLYSVYGPVGVRDTQNHNTKLPSLFRLRSKPADASDVSNGLQASTTSPAFDEVESRRDSSWILALLSVLAVLLVVALR